MFVDFIRIGIVYCFVLKCFVIKNVCFQSQITYRCAGVFAQSTNLKSLRDANEILQVIISDVNFSQIHILQNCLQDVVRDVVKEENRMLRVIVFQEIFEVRRAAEQNELVSSDLFQKELKNLIVVNQLNKCNSLFFLRTRK